MTQSEGLSATTPLTGCHVELHVTNLEAARAFYVDQLGLAILQETPAIRLLALRVGDIRMSIFGDAEEMDGSGKVHLVLGTHDIATAVRQLTGRGIMFAGPATEAPGFCRFVQTHDPDGNLVEIAQYLRDPLAVFDPSA